MTTESWHSAVSIVGKESILPLGGSWFGSPWLHLGHSKEKHFHLLLQLQLASSCLQQARNLSTSIQRAAFPATGALSGDPLYPKLELNYQGCLWQHTIHLDVRWPKRHPSCDLHHPSTCPNSSRIIKLTSTAFIATSTHYSPLSASWTHPRPPNFPIEEPWLINYKIIMRELRNSSALCLPSILNGWIQSGCSTAK